jgi:ribonuclease R
LIRAAKLGTDGLPDSADAASLGEIGASISATERRSMAAERETADRLIAHFLADRVGATFEGRISGVTRAGLFVKLDETGADGFIPARTLGDDYFRFNEAKRAMIGDATGETLTLGDRVSVRLAEAVPLAGALRFELLSGRKQDGGDKRPRSHRQRREDRGGRPAQRHRGRQRR